MREGSGSLESVLGDLSLSERLIVQTLLRENPFPSVVHLTHKGRQVKDDGWLVALHQEHLRLVVVQQVDAPQGLLVGQLELQRVGRRQAHDVVVLHGRLLPLQLESRNDSLEEEGELGRGDLLGGVVDLHLGHLHQFLHVLEFPSCKEGELHLVEEEDPGERLLPQLHQDSFVLGCCFPQDRSLDLEHP